MSPRSMALLSLRPRHTGAVRDGVAVVMPAYCEEGNLAATAADFLSTLEAAGHAHCLVIVNDGSSDDTGEVADSLAARHPERVRVVHHEANQGYGAALRTGIRTALEDTRLDKVFLTDADGQFKAEELPGFLDEAHRERADVVLGYRAQRAGSLWRKIKGAVWSRTSRVLLRTRSRDVGCAYKLIDRRVLTHLELTGASASVSPELVVKLRDQGARIIERPVRHYPRPHEGDGPAVAMRSLRGLVQLWWQRTFGRRLGRLLRGGDAVLRAVMAAAVLLSIASYIYFARHHDLLIYKDALSHLLNARRVVDGSPSGLAQLGGIWLPLPHVLALTGIWNNTLYYSGFASSVVSMVAYVVTVGYLYRIAVGLTGSKLAGVAGAAVFALNPNVLYMQATPLTELLLIACIAGTVCYLQRWCQTDDYRDLAKTSVAVLLATLTRYEGWVLFLAVSVVIVYVLLRRRESYARIEGRVIFFGFVAGSGIVGWLVWNVAIFHNVLYFQDGEYVNSSVVIHGEKAIGSWGTSLKGYFIAMSDNVGLIALVLAAIGLGLYLYRTRLRPQSVAPVVSVVFAPFFLVMLYSGQRPIHVTQIDGNLFNVRYGLMIVVAVSIFIAVVVGEARHVRIPRFRPGGVASVALAVLATAVVVVLPFRSSISTLQEGQGFRAGQQANEAAASWMRAHYDHGRVLMESFQNELVTFESHIPNQVIIYEGSFQRWLPALAHPAASGIRWIYMRRTPGNEDAVWNRLHDSVQLSSYRLVYQDSDRLVYELADSAPADHVAGEGK